MPIFNHPLPSPLPSRLWPSLGLALTIAGLPHVQASGKGDSKAAPPSSASASDPARFDPGPPAKDRYECAEPGPPPDWRGKRPPMEAIRPHARLAGADLSGMKLWFKDLRHIDFQDADLRDADFRGSDLSGAALYGVKGLGANFTDACLAMARTEGAQDLDFGKARVHSFFHWEPADRPGTMKLCRLADREFIPQSITLGAQGDLHLLGQDGSLVRLTRTGILNPLPLDQGAIKAVAGDGKGSFRLLLETRLLGYEQEALKNRQRAGAPQRIDFKAAPGLMGRITTYLGLGGLVPYEHAQVDRAKALLWTDAGTFWVSRPGVVTHYRQTQDRYTESPIDAVFQVQDRSETPTYASMAASGDGTVVLGVDPAYDRIYAHELPDIGRKATGKSNWNLKGLLPGSRPRHIVREGKRRYWYTAPGRDAIGYWDYPEKGMTKDFPVLPGRENVGLCGLALGRSGRLWYATSSPAGLGWLDEDGKGEHFPLDEGLIPQGLAAAGGEIYFILKERAMIGCIRDFDPLPADQAGSAPDSKADDKAAPQPKVRKRDRPLPFGRAEDECAADSKAAHAAPATGAPLGPAGSAPGATPAPAPPTLRQRLLAEGVVMDDGPLRHVLERHRWLAANNKGQFYLGHCTEDGILALVLDGWRRSGEPGKVKREYEPDDHCHTPVELAGEVGAYCSFDGWRATRCVEIVSRKEWREINGKMMEVQAVKSVFPVSRSRAGF